MDFKKRISQLKTDIPAVFLAMKRKETPLFAKVLAALTVAYALSPIDLIPDFIPVLGYLDDLIILPLLVCLAIKMIPEEVLKQCRQQAMDLWKDEKPKRWYYGLPIVMIWLLLLFLLITILIKL